MKQEREKQDIPLHSTSWLGQPATLPSSDWKIRQLMAMASKIAKIGGWEFDLKNNVVYWSDEIYKIREITVAIPQPFSIDDALNHYLPSSKVKIEQAITEAKEKGTPWDLELEMLTAKGNIRWVRDMGTVEMVGNKCVAIRGILKDITEQKNHNLQLLERERYYQLALKGADLGTWDWHINSGAVRFNERWTEMLGYLPHEIGNHVSDWDQLIHADDFPYVEETLQDHLDGKTDFYETEHRVKHKSGTWVWVLNRGRVVDRDEEGRPVRVSGTYMDISHRKKIELENFKLTHELEEFKAAINSASIVSITDVKGVIQYANENFQEISQFSQQELLGKRHSVVNSGFHPRSFWVDMWKTISRGKTWRAEVKNKRKDGEYYWVDTFVMPLKNMEGVITGYLSIRNDISQRKQGEEELKLALEKAKESDQLKSAFLANFSHEIRTPLNAIMGFSELLETHQLSDVRRNTFYRLIRQRGQDLLEIINNTLELAKLEAGNARPCDVEGNVQELLEKVVLVGKGLAGFTTHKKVPIYIQNKLSGRENKIIADFVQLNQVLTNLLSNALKFTDSGSIELGCFQSEPGQLVFFVADTGIGIPREKHTEIFKAFQQAGPEIHQRYGGSGLGLAICSRIVERWGGRLWVDSTLGKGSTFYFTLPFKEVKNSSVLLDGTINEHARRSNHPKWQDDANGAGTSSRW